MRHAGRLGCGQASGSSWYLMAAGGAAGRPRQEAHARQAARPPLRTQRYLSYIYQRNLALARNVACLLRFRTRPGPLAAQIFGASRARGPLHGRSQRQCGSDVAHRPAPRMVRTGLDMVQCFHAAGCRRLLQSSAAAWRRSSSRWMLELQLFAAGDSGCRCRLQRLCGHRIAMLLLFSLVCEQQQKLLRVVDNVREPGERALHRVRSGCNRRRLRRAMRAGVRPCDILQRTAVASQCMRACVHAISELN